MKQASDLQIFTIGHGNKNQSEFLGLLKRYDIEILIDVRSYPYSRYNPQFRRKQLQVDLESSNINYLFLGNELGGRPDNPNLYSNGILNYDELRKTTLYQVGLERVVEIVKLGVKVTLMCSESDHNDCHRKHLISKDIIKAGLSIFHINKKGNLEKETYSPSLFY